MPTLVVDRTQTREALLGAAERVAEMIRPLADTGVSIPGEKWTVGEAASHIANAAELFVDLAGGAERSHGDKTRESLAAANAAWLAGDPERGGAALADRIADATRRFVDSVAGRPPSQMVRSPAGEMSLDQLMSYLLTHTLGHGVSIARALHKPLPVRKQDPYLMLPFFEVAIANFVDESRTKNHRATYVLHVRGGPEMVVRVENGTASLLDKRPSRIDCHISGDPMSLFLVGLGLKSQWGPIATFKLTTWGRKPWLALRFVGHFEKP